MKPVLIALAACDFDPSEVAVAWAVLTQAGLSVRFATPSGGTADADDRMLTGAGLDPWSRLPGLSGMRLVGRMLRADKNARNAYRRMMTDPFFLAPMRYADLDTEEFSGLVLPGGHRARGIRPYLENAVLQAFVGAFFDSGKPVGAICHGVVLAARSRSPRTGRSVLYGRKTTALTWDLEAGAWNLTRHFLRSSERNYYRTYVEGPDEPAGARSVETEVTAALAAPADFVHVAARASNRFRKNSGLFRDGPADPRPAHVVVDGNYVSARWPGDVYTFASRLAAVILSAVAPTARSAAL